MHEAVGHTAMGACCQAVLRCLQPPAFCIFTQGNALTPSSCCITEDRCHACLLLRCQMCWSRGEQDIQHAAPN